MEIIGAAAIAIYVQIKVTKLSKFIAKLLIKE